MDVARRDGGSLAGRQLNEVSSQTTSMSGLMPEPKRRPLLGSAQGEHISGSAIIFGPPSTGLALPQVAAGYRPCTL